jgi:hypothetical protein
MPFNGLAQSINRGSHLARAVTRLPSGPGSWMRTGP